MAEIITLTGDGGRLEEAADRFLAARYPTALTGAGMSVESGIPDFRGPGGLWQRFPPEEFATLGAFRRDPVKTWRLYRAVGRALEQARPNPAHEALAALEASGLLGGVITQNIDRLHQAAGSRKVVEMHGEHSRLQCVDCDALEPFSAELLDGDHVPTCRRCDAPLKPNVVLFGEEVRGSDEIETLLESCDLLLVVGTSAQIYPAAGLPGVVKAGGGLVYEFNLEPTELTRGAGGGLLSNLLLDTSPPAGSDYLFQGPAGQTLPRFVARVLERRPP